MWSIWLGIVFQLEERSERTGLEVLLEASRHTLLCSISAGIFKKGTKTDGPPPSR